MHNQREFIQVTHGHMSDADRVRDCLSSSKEKCLMYAKAAVEATSPGMREFFLAMHGEETHNQEVLFSFLHVRNQYPVMVASDERIRSVREWYRQVHDQMGLTDNPSMRRYQTMDPKLPPARAQNPESFEYKGDSH